MNEMNMNSRGYDDRDYDNRYDNRYSYRYDDRNYRYDDRDYDERRRNYDRRGGKINNRNYRNYRENEYYEELEMLVDDMRMQYRKLEDISEMAENQQDKSTIMRIAQKEKENYNYLKQIMEK